MKSLHDYLIQEKLKLNGNIVLSSKWDGKTVKLDIPIANRDTGKIDEEDIWKSVNMPDAKFVIVKDAYRHNKPHFMVIGDFLFQLMMFQDDYEDFNPSKTILFASNDLDEVIHWYCEYLKIDSSIFNLEDYGDIQTELENDSKVDYDKTCDSIEFFARLITSDKDEKWNEKDLSSGLEKITFDNYVDAVRDYM